MRLCAQAPAHEAPFLERHPPFARLARAICVQSLDEARCKFLPHLRQVLPQVIYGQGVNFGLPIVNHYIPASARLAGDA